MTVPLPEAAPEAAGPVPRRWNSVHGRYGAGEDHKLLHPDTGGHAIRLRAFCCARQPLARAAPAPARRRPDSRGQREQTKTAGDSGLASSPDRSGTGR